MAGALMNFPTNTPSRLASRFYLWFPVCAFLIVFAGFARTYYLRPIFEVRPLPLLLHLHGFLFTSWFVLFFVQARLVAKDRVDLHRRLGILGAILAPLCTGVALTVAIHAGRRSYLANPASFTNLGVRPLAMDFGTSLMFLLLVAIALYLRRRPDFHNRVMVLACCSILLPAIGRIPYVWDTVGFWGLVAVTEIPPLGCILYDTIKHRRLHPAFAWGGAAVLASFPAFMLIGVTDPWLRFMIWLLSR